MATPKKNKAEKKRKHIGRRSFLWLSGCFTVLTGVGLKEHDSKRKDDEITWIGHR